MRNLFSQIVTLSLSILTFIGGCGPSSQDYLDEGLVKMKSDSYEEAIECFTNAIQVDHQNGDAYFQRAKARIMCGQYEDACEDLELAIQANSHNENTYLERGKVRMMLGMFEEAIEDFDNVTGLNHTNQEAHARKARAYLSLGLYQEAIESTIRALSLNPADCDALSDQATAYFSAGRYEEAINSEMMLIENDSTRPRPYFNVAVAYDELKNYDMATEYYLAAKDLGYDHSLIDERLEQLEALRNPVQKTSARTTSSTSKRVFVCYCCNGAVDLQRAITDTGDLYSESSLFSLLLADGLLDLYCSRKCFKACE